MAHVCIFANDIEETKRFYHDVLGLDVAFNFVRDGKVFGFYFDLGGRSHIEVFEKPEAAFSENDQINHLYLEVDNLDQAIDHIRSAGGEIIKDKKLTAPVHTRPGPKIRMA